MADRRLTQQVELAGQEKLMPSDTPIHTLTFEELKAKAQAGETLVSRQGYPIQTRDRKFDEKKALELWTHDCKEYGMPEDTRPKNKKGRRFSWSYSALNDFSGDQGCPKRYADQKFFCTVPFVESEAIVWGNRQHAAPEQFLKGEPVKEPELLRPIQKYLDLFIKQREAGAVVTAELEIVLNQYMKPLVTSDAWFSDKAWFRCKIDVDIQKGSKLNIIDWKSGGKVKADVDQLKICCAARSIVDSSIEEFTGKLIWTKHDVVTGGCNLNKQDVRDVWEQTLVRVRRLEEAWKTENFPPRKNAFCKWCASRKECIYG